MSNNQNTSMPNDSEQTQAPALRILSLDGDGVSVLSELTIIHELMYRIQVKQGSPVMPRPCEWFQLMGGTGTGGLVAILLGRLRLPIDEATRCYLSIMDRVFNKKHDGPQERARELERVMSEMLGRYINNPDAPMIDTHSETPICKVVVYVMPTANIQAGTPTCIRTYRVAENQGLECSIAEAIRATMAAPGILRRKAIHDGEVEVSYIGAMLGCNNPTAQLLVEPGRAYPDWATACVFSAGAGQLHPVGLREPKRLLESVSSQLATATEAIVKDCERTHQEVAVRFSHVDGVYFRFNPEQGMQDVDQSNSKMLSEVQTHTKVYLADAATSGRLNEAVKAITSGKGTSMLLNGNVILLLQNQLKIGQCPAPSTMFTGREDLLEILRIYFFDNSQERHLFVLYGLGGAGKTQVALAFVHRYKKLFWDVFYIDATTHDTIKAGLRRLAKKAKAGDTHEDALDWLDSQEQRWLIVYNNADDPAIDLSDYFPKCAHGDILITTRNRKMVLHSNPGSHCRVGDMQEHDARTLLFRTSGVQISLESESAAAILVKHLGFLALAIVQAGAYMRSTQCNMADYIDLFLSSRDRLLTQHSGQTDGYKLTAYATWDVSYTQLLPRAARLLRLMSFMHHDGISVEIFKVAAANLSNFHADVPLTTEESSMQKAAWDWLTSFMMPENTWDMLCWDQLTNNLRSFSLLDYDPMSQTYSMHPLVHAWCRSIVQDPKGVREHAAWVLGLCVTQRHSSKDFAFQRLLLPHATAVLVTNEPIPPALAANLVWIFEDANDTKQAEKLHSYILKASRERLGPNHTTALLSMHNLANAYRIQGRWTEAETMLVEVWEAEERVLGKKHPNVLSTMSSLALTYESQGRSNEAEAMLLEVLRIQKLERVLGKEHPDSLSTMYHLASTYKSQGRSNEAEAMLLEVLGVRKRVLDEDHPNLLTTMYTLASTYKSQGRWKEAEAMLLEVLEGDRRVFGDQHPYLLSTMFELASTYLSQGRWNEAEAILLEVLEGDRRVLGKEHPHLLSTMSLLASTHQRQGRWNEAEAMLLKVLRVQRRILGKEHPNLLANMYTLASTYKSQGRWNEAEAMLVEVLEAQKRVFGKEHPDLLSTMYKLASTYNSQGRWNEAEAMLLEVLKGDRRVLGKDHPDLLSTMYTLASTYNSQGRWNEAETMLLEVLEVQTRVLGKEHPYLLSTMHELASTFQSQRRWNEAEAMLLEVLQVRRRVLGQEHPDLLTTMSTLASTYKSQGQWKEAEAMLLEVSEAQKRVLNKEHPDLMSTMHLLAATYDNLKRWKEAEALLVGVVEVRKRVFGREHPDSVVSISLLASVYASQGRLSDAELLKVDNLDISKRVLGLNHPDTLTLTHNLALTYNHQGKLVEAERLMMEALELRQQVFGEQHADTQSSAEALAMIRAHRI